MMNENQSAAIICMITGGVFLLMAVVFAWMKAEGALLISGFNTLPKEIRDQYDRARMSRDMRNANLLWGVILIIGGLLSYFVNNNFAIAAFVLWLILFFKDVKLDVDKAFGKYRL